MASRLTNKEEYKIAAEKMAGYLFGQNPQNLSYITGISNNAAHSPHFRPSMSGKHKVPEGLLVGGANNKEYAGDLKGLALAHKPALQIYADHQDSWATNEVAINWQAALASFLGLLAAN
jgi:endoglucanase